MQAGVLSKITYIARPAQEYYNHLNDRNFFCSLVEILEADHCRIAFPVILYATLADTLPRFYG